MLDIDYSVFDRETLYVNKEKNIEKEYIIERIYPDVINTSRITRIIKGHHRKEKK